MKKLFCILLGVALVLSITSCGKSEEVTALETQIDAIGSVSLDSEAAITAAESAYAALSEKDQSKVANLDTLTSARAAYDECVLEEEHRLAVEEYNAAIETYNNSVESYNDAVNQYNVAANAANAANADFRKYIVGINDSGIFQEKAYDDSTIQALLEITTNAKLAIEEDVDLRTPKDTYAAEDMSAVSADDIISKASSLTADASVIDGETPTILNAKSDISIPDYTDKQAEVQAVWDAAIESVAIEAQITAPSEEFVISRLYTVSAIDGIEAATENNDPNSKLNKAKGYTADVFFRVPVIDSSLLFGNSILEIGTQGGGSIEVYSTLEDAETRNEYLSSFDGTILSNGAHIILGTMIVRVSDELTASQQNALLDEITSAMIALE